MSNDTVIGKNIKTDEKLIYLLITIVMIYAYCHIIQMEYLLCWLIYASILYMHMRAITLYGQFTGN